MKRIKSNEIPKMILAGMMRTEGEKENLVSNEAFKKFEQDFFWNKGYLLY